MIGGAASETLYAGEAPGLAGADQINLRLPRTLTKKRKSAVAGAIVREMLGGLLECVKAGRRASLYFFNFTYLISASR